jgi:hypothetical protein
MAVDGVAIGDAQTLRDRIRAGVREGQGVGQRWTVERAGRSLEVAVTPRVVREGERFIAVHVDLSQRTPEEDALLASYNQRGLPLVVMHGSEGDEEHRVTQFIEPDEMLGLMRNVD